MIESSPPPPDEAASSKSGELPPFLAEEARDEGEEPELELDAEAEPSARVRTLDESILVARLFFFAGRVGEADRLLRPLVRAHPDRRELFLLWGHIKHTQGQLTEAIRAFERVEGFAPTEPSALVQLEMLHRMSQHPDSGKREAELELVGNPALVRTHGAHRELERAFRLAASHKFTSAVDVCEQVAQRHRVQDPNLYKLALLERALLLEGINQFDGAVSTLERLGGTRGFEVDRDRLLSLARVYERRGTPDDLARATKIYAFLFEQTREPEWLSRMSSLAARRGDPAEAERLAARFIQGFRREQLELELEELLEAAALQYLPLASLRALAPDRGALLAYQAELERAERTPARRADDERKLAILLALIGASEASEALFRGLIARGAGRPEDSKYWADLRLEVGDLEGARSLDLAALSDEAVADAHILTRLFQSEDERLAPLLAPIFREAEKRAQTHEALKQRAKGHQLSPEVWQTLARYERLVGFEDEAARHGAKAQALAQALERTGPRIGHVQVAAVYEFQGKKRGLVHEIWASRYRVSSGRSGQGGQLDEGSIFGNVAQDMMRDIQNVFVAVRVFVQQKFPHLVGDLDDHRYVLKVTKDDELSGGNSAGIAVALAFLSVFLQRPLPTDFAITGSLVADSSSEIRLRRIADVDYKALGTYQRRLARLIAPAENRVDLEASHVVPRSVWESRVAFARNLTQVMKLVFGDDVWEW